MYRLLKNASSKVNYTNFSKLKLNHNFSSPCSLCNREFLFIPGMKHSSSRKLTTEGTEKKKKVRRSKKKYAELSEVNEDSNNTTAVLNELTTSQISQLDNQVENGTKSSKNFIPDEGTSLLNVDSSLINDFLLEKQVEEEIKLELIQSYKKKIDVISEFRSDCEENKVVMVPNNGEEVLPSMKLLDPETIRNNELTSEKLDQSIIEEFNNNLVSYIDLCVHCDSLNVGFGALARYTNKSGRRNRLFTLHSARSFNSLMHGFAKKGNIDKVMELLLMMRSSGVRPNPQSYAAAFDAVGRQSPEKTVTEILMFLREEMKSEGLGFQHLFDHCSYVGDQRECVLKAIHLLDPDFVPRYEPPVLHYDCALLEDLNKNADQSYTSPCHGLVSKQEMEKFIDEQIEIERSSSVSIKSVVKPPQITKEIEQNRAKWNELQNMWRASISEAIEKELQIMGTQLSVTKLCYSINIYPYLKALTVEQHVDIILQELRKLVQGSEDLTINSKWLQKNLGHQVYLRYRMERKQKYKNTNGLEKMYKNYCKWYLNPDTNPGSVNTRQQWQHLSFSSAVDGASMDDPEQIWPSNVIRKIGEFLCEVVKKKIKIDVICYQSDSKPIYLPAFFSFFRHEGPKLIEELKPHPNLVRLYKESYFDELLFDVNVLPMVSPPVPWTSPKIGGYVIAEADLVRSRYESSNKVIEELTPQRLYPVFDSLNQLSAVPWRINEKVLDVVLEVFRNGGSSRLDIPQDTSSYVPTDLPFGQTDEKLTYRQKSVIDKKKAEVFALWCEALYRLSLANHYRKRIFWLPHNMDFRGRTYPVPPHLTYLGNDMARSLLRFANGRKLGPKGLDRLKIHCVNLTGLKKRDSLAERLKYADELLPDILDSAENPLTGKMWWAESEEQWQTLACCMEIKAAIESGDPQNYLSQLPLHQDASCIGLQHYVALGRDEKGAKSVNMTVSDTPQDLYSCVANLVETERDSDAKIGLEIAKSLKGFIERIVIKETVQAAVFGATAYGMQGQIAEHLKGFDQFPKYLLYDASSYVKAKTFSSLRNMFTSWSEIQGWLTNCAKFIPTYCGSNVEWRTSLGLRVVQPYSEMKISTVLNDKNGQLNDHTLYIIRKPNAVKQKNAFVSNFIHSLDSSHMMLTSLFCERQGITFVSVHDGFWTHPCTVDEMSQICREQFVALHSEPVLENLSEYLMKKFSTAYSLPRNLICELPHKVLTKVPPKGRLNLQDVLKSTYFFN